MEFDRHFLVDVDAEARLLTLMCRDCQRTTSHLLAPRLSVYDRVQEFTAEHAACSDDVGTQTA